MGRIGWGWLPISVVLLMTLCVLVTYVIAVFHGDVAALFPYISDAGAEFPASAIFAQFLNTAACVATATVYIRYCLVMYVTDGGRHRNVGRLSAVGLVLSVMACFGLSLVGNFQDNKLPPVHFTGAALVFVFGGIYCFIDTAVTYKMAPEYNGIIIAHIRLIISILGVVGLITTSVGGAVATIEWNNGNVTDSDRQHWKPTDPGYAPHLVSTFGEWVMALAFVLYFASHINDFRKLQIGMHMRMLVLHLSDSITTQVEIENTAKSEPDENTGLLA